MEETSELKDALASVEDTVVKPAKVEHLVVDSGAFIHLENLFGKSQRFYTIREVIAEVRDEKAREMLNSLPFEIEIKEPSDEAINAVVDFAKKTGDLYSLSKTDIKVIALTYMVHAEVHGTKSIRKNPLPPGSSEPEMEENEDDDETPINLTPKPKAPLPQNLGEKKPGVSWAAALNGASNSTSTDSASTKPAEPQTKQQPTQPPKPPAASSMWDDDDFAGVSAEGTDKSTDLFSPAPAAEASEEWPSLDVNVVPGRTEIVERFQQTKMTLKQEVKEINDLQEEKLKKREKKRLEKKKALEMEQVNNETQEVESELEKPTPKAPITESRLLGFGGVKVDGIATDTFEDDGEGWITTENLDTVHSLSQVGGNTGELKKPMPVELKKVACITTDFGMQNVMMQMQLRLLTMEGRALNKIRRFVLKCTSCGEICRKLEKRFCQDCGNPTLAKLTYSIDAQGVLRYHYRKGFKVNTRGMKYSIPKPRGGREGDLLLAEDQLKMGWWQQQARKKSSVTSMFGEHVTESFGLSFTESNNLRIGYGNQNPNAAKGRERRGKKTKRREKRPGYL